MQGATRSADCVGVIADAAEFALWPPNILANIQRVLEELFKWEHGHIEHYLTVITAAAKHSGGGVIADVPRTVHDCPDHEDNFLDLQAPLLHEMTALV
jgi:hypothetical protein